ncbi:signal transducer and transcription activator-like [Contarinia nasturtii]|uniref:signal transducer and transcription activator-like n=1 Tax=Contarinia nasturtii TaxID=265458 RepID=UPI0012D44AE3|nr:signal transducer and transcription activator-like [Contarinia nasturtii]XP_031631699.1 signal transducer and transcription activator-like [Contarinia nasturtii]
MRKFLRLSLNGKEKTPNENYRNPETRGVYNRIGGLKKLHKENINCYVELPKEKNDLVRKNMYLGLVAGLQEVAESLNKLFLDTILRQIHVWNCDDSLYKDPSILDDFQTWFSELTSIILANCELIKKLERYTKNSFKNELERMHSLFNQIFAKCFVIKHHPRVIKYKDSNFNLVLKALMPGVKIVTGTLDLFSGERRCGYIDINKFTTEKQGHFHLTCKLKNLQRTRENDTVLDEKYTLKLSLEFQMEAKPKQPVPVSNLPNATLELTSLSITAISNSSQEASAQATILWDEMHRKYDGSEFYHRNKVFWSDFEDIINSLFMETGHTLSSENQRYIYEKWCGTSAEGSRQYNREISRTELFQRKDPKAKFTHWEWLFAALKLIRDYLSEEWRKGRIVGFISKDETKKILYNYSHTKKVFLLRFSDSTLGAISPTTNDGSKNIVKLGPITKDDFKNSKSSENLTVGDIIREISELGQVYCFDGQIIEKKEAFTFTSDNTEKSKNGYNVLFKRFVTLFDQSPPAEGHCDINPFAVKSVNSNVSLQTASTSNLYNNQAPSSNMVTETEAFPQNSIGLQTINNINTNDVTIAKEYDTIASGRDVLPTSDIETSNEFNSIDTNMLNVIIDSMELDANMLPMTDNNNMNESLNPSKQLENNTIDPNGWNHNCLPTSDGFLHNQYNDGYNGNIAISYTQSTTISADPDPFPNTNGIFLPNSMEAMTNTTSFFTNELSNVNNNIGKSMNPCTPPNPTQSVATEPNQNNSEMETVTQSQAYWPDIQ